MNNENNIDEHIKEIEEKCRDLIEYLKENHNPYTYVVVSQDNIMVMNTALSIVNSKINWQN